MELKAVNAKVIKKNNRVIKQFHTPHEHITDEWFDAYSLYEKTYQNVVKVHEYSPECIVMEYVHGKEIDLDQYWHAKEYSYDLYKKFHHLLEQLSNFDAQFHEFAIQYKKAFYHHDCGHGNMILTADNKIMLIDPDAFKFDYFVDYKKLDQLYQVRKLWYEESSKCANHLVKLAKDKGMLWM